MAVDYNYEFVFMTLSRYMTLASNTSILRDSNISIADTSATSDTTPCLYGLKIYWEVSKEDAITDSSDTNISASKRG